MSLRSNPYADRQALLRRLPRVADLPPMVLEHRTHRSAVEAFPRHCDYACAVEVYRPDRTYEIATAVGVVLVTSIALAQLFLG
jgi:hypothetical protein